MTLNYKMYVLFKTYVLNKTEYYILRFYCFYEKNTLFDIVTTM